MIARGIVRQFRRANKKTTMKTLTEINEATFKQRIPMLTTAPAAPVSGRGNIRIDLGLAPDWAFRLKSGPHYALVSKREQVNRFGKLGTPKHLMVSPEFFALFN